MRRTITALALAAAILVPTARAVSARQERPSPTITYMVRPGDTLWGIARDAAPDADTRRFMHRISELNDLSGPLLPGQKIALPAR